MPRGRPIVTPLTLTPEQVTSLTLGWGAKFGPEGSSIIGSPSGNPE